METAPITNIGTNDRLNIHAMYFEVSLNLKASPNGSALDNTPGVARSVPSTQIVKSHLALLIYVVALFNFDTQTQK